MKETFTDEKRLRRYLLDELAEDEQVAIEARLLVDHAYLEQLQIIEEDLIDDYLREKLSPPERAKFERQFNTPECRQKIQLASAFHNYLRTLPAPEYPAPSLLRRMQEVWRQLVSPPVLRAAAAVLVLTFGLGLWWMMTQRSDARRGVNALEDAYGAARPLEARISSFPYARFYGAPDQTSARVNAAQLRLADKAFRNLQSKERTVEASHALGKYNLTARRFDAAIEDLSAAVTAKPNQPQLHVDLAVALLERAKQRLNDAQSAPAQADFAASRSHLEEALRLNPASTEALFNLALLHQARGSWSEAIATWEAYLQKDAGSPWAEEARKFLDAARQAQK